MLKRIFPTSEALRIGLSKNGVSVLRSTGILRRKTTILAEQTFSSDVLADIATDLRTVLSKVARNKEATTFILSDDWVRLFMVTPPQNATRLQDCRAAADLRFQALYGEPPEDWVLLGDWDVRYPYLACAVPKQLLTILDQIATASGLTLVKIAPQFIAGWNRWHRKLAQNAWFAVVHGKTMTFGMVEQRRLTAVRTATLPSDVDKAWLTECIAQDVLRFGQTVPEQLQIVGSFPAAWSVSAGALVCSQLDANFIGSQNVLDSAGVSLGISLARCGMRR